jgi:hypothetical protein
VSRARRALDSPLAAFTSGTILHSRRGEYTVGWAGYNGGITASGIWPLMRKFLCTGALALDTCAHGPPT